MSHRASAAIAYQVELAGGRWVLLAAVLAVDVHALLSAPAPRCGRQLAQSELDLLGSQRYVSIPGWLSEAQTDSLQADAMATGACEDAFDCCVGSAAGGPRLDEGVRRSRQCNLYPPPPNAAGSTVARAWLIDAVQALRGELQASVTMALPPLSPFETELAYLMYPVGGHYKRHLDIPRSNDDAGWKLQGRPSNLGGSLCGGRTRRVVSFILYLNRQWDPANGGAICRAGSCTCRDCLGPGLLRAQTASTVQARPHVHARVDVLVAASVTYGCRWRAEGLPRNPLRRAAAADGMAPAFVAAAAAASGRRRRPDERGGGHYARGWHAGAAHVGRRRAHGAP